MEAPKMSYQELLALYDKQQAEIKRLEAENKAKERQPNTLSFKVRAKGERYEKSDGTEGIGKGAVSCYGLGRFPVTLYAPQWRRLATMIKEGKLDAFLEENKAKLSEERD